MDREQNNSYAKKKKNAWKPIITLGVMVINYLLM